MANYYRQPQIVTIPYDEVNETTLRTSDGGLDFPPNCNVGSVFGMFTRQRGFFFGFKLTNTEFTIVDFPIFHHPFRFSYFSLNLPNFYWVLNILHIFIYTYLYLFL